MPRLVFLLCYTTAALLASGGADAGDTLTTTAELNRFWNGSKNQHTGLALTGTVTVVHGSEPYNFVIQDQTGSVELFDSTAKACLALNVGDIVAISGRVHLSSNLERWAEYLTCVKLGAAAPPPPCRVPLAALDDPAINLKMIETEATIIDSSTDDLDPRVDFLTLKDGPTLVPLICPHKLRLDKLVDARVRVKGLLRRELSSERKFVGPNISIASESDITVLTPPPEDKFAFPRLVPFSYTSPKEVVSLGKRSIEGTVIAAWQNSHLLIRTGDERMPLIRLELAAGETLPACGDQVTAVGYPITDVFRLMLTRVRLRKEQGPAQRDEPAVPVTISALLHCREGHTHFDYRYYGRLVTIRGVVSSLFSPSERPNRMLLDCNGVKIPIDYSANTSIGEGQSVGSVIEVTGRCILEVNPWHSNNILPRINGLILVPRRPADITVISGPPWWTPQRLMILVAILLLALVGVYIRNLVLKRLGKMKLRERTQLAVELHDSLSQTLAGLACQIGASQDALHTDAALAEAKLQTADQILKSCRTELRHCLFDLRNDTFAEKDFKTAIERTVAPLGTDTEIAVRFNVRRNLFDDATVHAILAIIRELVANAVRHGQAWNVRVAGTVDNGALLFSVRDNGCGFDPADRPGAANGHYGLAGIDERLKKMSGVLTINSRPGHGAKVTVRIPIRKP